MAEIDDLKAAVASLASDVSALLVDATAKTIELQTQVDALTVSLAADDTSKADLQAQLDALKAAAVDATASIVAADTQVKAAFPPVA